MENTFKIENETWHPVEGWEHRYAVSESGRIARISIGLNCEKTIVRELGKNNARNIVFTEVVLGKKREKAFDKKTLCFDTFNPNVRLKKGKTVKFKDGNKKNFSKNNLILSDKNAPGSAQLSEVTIMKAQEMKNNGKDFEYIKEALSLSCSRQLLDYKIKIYEVEKR